MVEQVPIRSEANPHNAKYLETKKVKMGHLLCLRSADCPPRRVNFLRIAARSKCKSESECPAPRRLVREFLRPDAGSPSWRADLIRNTCRVWSITLIKNCVRLRRPRRFSSSECLERSKFLWLCARWRHREKPTRSSPAG